MEELPVPGNAMPEDLDFADEIKRLRRERGLSVEGAAARLYGVSPGLVARWESGKLPPGADLRKAILDKLGSAPRAERFRVFRDPGEHAALLAVRCDRLEMGDLFAFQAACL